MAMTIHWPHTVRKGAQSATSSRPIRPTRAELREHRHYARITPDWDCDCRYCS